MNTFRLTSWVLLATMSFVACNSVPALAQTSVANVESSVGFSDERTWPDPSALLSTADPAFHPEAVRQSAGRAIQALPIREALLWSGAKGYLLQARLQAPLQAGGAVVPLGTPAGLGVGNSVLDAAIAAGVRPRTEAPAEPGMRVAKERSFYLWATLEHRWLFPDRIVYQRLTTDESARIDEQVMPFQFSAERTRAYMDARRITLLEGIAAHATRQAIGADAKKQIDQKIATYVNRSDTLGRSASALDKMRNEERRLTNTLQQVERFQNILTMSSLRVQANAQEELRKEVAKAKSAADLINVLKAGHAAALAKIQTAEPAVNALAAQQDKAYGEFFDVLPVPPDQRERLRELL